MNYIKVSHKLEMINNKKEFVIYADYPFEYEFGLDFNNFKQKVEDISVSIKEYVKKNLSTVKNATAILVLNGIIVGTFALSQVVEPNVEEIKEEETNIVGEVADEGQNIVKDATSQDTLPEENIDNLVNVTQDSKEKSSSSNISSGTAGAAAIPATVKTQNVNSNTSNNKTNNNAVVNNNQSSTSNTNTSANSQQVIKLKLNTGEVINIDLEEYVIGVVGSEMPALFNSEALKAQAVAARTFALKKKALGATLTSTTADQVYKTNSELKNMWGGSYSTYYNKVKNAVMATKGEVMMYNGNYIDALYFSTSNGKTEEPIYVWKYTEPYLKSVDSKWDVGVSSFSGTKTISKSEISQKLGVSLTSISQIKINSYTTGGRVNSITIAGKEFTGVQIRTLLGLRSTDFSVSESGDNIVFLTKGWGHGVGMSQYGANGMANAGYSYSQILKHYYTGITITKK